ncbi:MAG: hypothetical protein K2N53_00205, partial [Clostridia bacterium]|nr:hypothetical protein [Clostridia bacterium]
MLFAVLGMVIFGTHQKADAETANATNVGSLTLKDYEKGGKIFDKEIFWSLITQITGDTNPNRKTLKDLGATAKTSSDFRGLSVNGGKDVTVYIGDIPWTATYLSQNENNEPILTLWQADAMPFNYYNASTNAIVNNAVTATWSTTSNHVNAVAKYPSNSYGTSFMATSVLNNGGAWANIGSSTTNVEQNANSTYARFTMDSVPGSLTSFIEVPNNVPFQNSATSESANTYSYHTTYKYDANNDALVAPIAANMFNAAYMYYGNSSVDQTGYLAWGNDKIWLPSLAEVGYSTEGGASSGLWKTSTNQRSTSTSVSGTSVDWTWLRSAGYDYYSASYVLSAAGTSVGYHYTTYVLAVRPAFHLNLQKVADTLSYAKPTDVETVYNGLAQDIEDISEDQLSWYDPTAMDITFNTSVMQNVGTYTCTVQLKQSVIDEDMKFDGDPDTSKGETATKRIFNFVIKPKVVNVSWTDNPDGVPIPSIDDDDICSNGSGAKDTVKINVEYTNTNDGSKSTSIPKVVGSYRVDIISISNSNYELAPNAVKSRTFTLTERNIPIPTFYPSTWRTYDGSKKVYVLEFGEDYIGDFTVHIPTEYDGKINWDADALEVSAINAGTYSLELRLTDDVNTQWRYDNGTVTKSSIRVEFKILPLTLDLQIVHDGATIDCALGEDVEIYIEAMQLPREGDTVLLDFYVSRDGTSAKRLVYENLALTSTGVNGNAEFSVTLNLSQLSVPANWRLQIVTKNEDGDSEFSNYELNVNDIVFNVEETVDVNTVIFWRLSVDGIFKTSVTTELDNYDTIEFDKETMIYTGKEYSFAVRMPSGYSVDTSYSVDGYIKGYKNAIGVNAGEYITTARVKTPDSSIVEYSISWTIDKAHFDLSQVKWLYDGQLPYNKVSGSEAILDPKTLPVGLDPHYSNNTGTTVGTSGTAYVTFTLASGYEGNYVLPEENVPNSYIDPNEDFVWNKSWNIVKAVIQSSSWKNSSTTVNDKAFDIPVLRDPNADGDVVKYEYYECDSNGNILNQTPISVNDIVWSESEAKFYKAKPVLQDTLNYEL